MDIRFKSTRSMYLFYEQDKDPKPLTTLRDCTDTQTHMYTLFFYSIDGYDIQCCNPLKHQKCAAPLLNGNFIRGTSVAPRRLQSHEGNFRYQGWPPLVVCKVVIKVVIKMGFLLKHLIFIKIQLSNTTFLVKGTGKVSSVLIA